MTRHHTWKRSFCCGKFLELATSSSRIPGKTRDGTATELFGKLFLESFWKVFWKVFGKFLELATSSSQIPGTWGTDIVMEHRLTTN
jgi:hypothetical protein